MQRHCVVSPSVEAAARLARQQTGFGTGAGTLSLRQPGPGPGRVPLPYQPTLTLTCTFTFIFNVFVARLRSRSHVYGGLSEVLDLPRRLAVPTGVSIAASC